jgi:TolB protein
MVSRLLAPGQRCQVHLEQVDRPGRAGPPAPALDTGLTTVLDTDEVLLEAPNWTHDGRQLILNGDGGLWQLSLDGIDAGSLSRIDLDVPELNNDHVLDPDGAHIYLSANDGHIYRAELTGGAATRVTEDDYGLLHFLHGVSPDGQTLVFTGVEVDGDVWDDINLYRVAAEGGPARRLTVGTAPKDGPEFSPDGEWIYFNTEQFSTDPGHAQIARMRADGSAIEQLTFDDRVNWFPHFAPSGDRALYLSFPAGTEGHPGDLDVRIMLVTDDWNEPTIGASLFGGQGTVNVNSWSPDGARYAFVSYPQG